MEKIAKGGKNVYGYKIGILMLDSTFPRIQGDIGNAFTWNFPVLYKKVVGGTPKKVVLELTKEDVAPFIEAAKDLEKEGVRAITTSCGFLALFQKEMADAVNIPVLTSALLLVPLVYKMLGSNKKVGILTANKSTLTKNHFRSVGAENIPCVIKGLETKDVFTNFTVQNWQEVDIEACRRELIDSTEELMQEDENIGAIVLECTNMPPFTEDIKKTAGIPVFDIVSLVNMIYESL
jgi:Asp/Glu/hydantoin racemase